MRGVPGSGKSTLAKSLGGVICSADDFFVGEDGMYRFDPSKIGEAHKECFASFLNCFEGPFGHTIADHRDIIIDNTNTQLWEISPYLALARHANLGIRFIRVECNLELAAERNVHGVPKGAIMAMHKRMENIPPFWGKEEVVSGI